MSVRANISLLAVITLGSAASPAIALTAAQVGPQDHPVYGATQSSDNDILVADLDELIKKQGAGKVVIFGGVHGYKDTGVPTAAANRNYACGEMANDEKTIKNAYKTKYKKEANFNYVDVGQTYAKQPNGDLTDKGLNNLYDDATKRASGGVVSYLAWCWAGTWYRNGGGH
jgi:hypothetical protein